ncbi:MAG: Asp23/Gls24 family envelope stress response protein [Bacillota bacterium]|nr:Asp23/Gls24 family envelope stress response protein [Bacillota bacterium]
MTDSNERMQTKVQKDGKISFADDVIATIAGLAASEVPGLAGMSGGIVDGIVEFLGKKNFTKGVKVEVGNEEAAIDLFVVMEYGAKIHEVCAEIQQAVKRAVETMTGLRVMEVNVFVQGVRFEKESKEGDAQRVR